MNHSIWLPLVLQIAFFVVLILEFIIPSAGVLTVVSLLCLGGSWWMIATSKIAGLISIVLVADVILIPITLWVGFRLMQKSPLANREDLSQGYQTQNDLAEALVGQEGVSSSMLKPSGKVLVDGMVYDAVSTGEYLDAGIRVRVLYVSQNRLTVEAIDQGVSL